MRPLESPNNLEKKKCWGLERIKDLNLTLTGMDADFREIAKCDPRTVLPGRHRRVHLNCHLDA
jgi:hypothetical protein